MSALLDTSVLVAAVVDQLKQHPVAMRCFRDRLDEGGACCSAHSLAECYATLTALPLARRVQPHEAVELIERNFLKNLKVISLPAGAHMAAIRRIGRLGLRSGVIYDALHLACAEKQGCEALYTFNLRDFKRLQPSEVEVRHP